MSQASSQRAEASAGIVRSRRILPEPVFAYPYSICTLVTDWDEYAEMLDSFHEHGFFPARCEYLHVDNTSGNARDGFDGGNALLAAAQGRYVIFCHQDVLLLEDGADRLEACIEELDRLDPRWAVLGNAGGISLGRKAIRITDPFGTFDLGPFPARVSSLDENFLVIKNQAGLRFSTDLGGFHFYGTDLCQVAAFRGYRSYVVDFHLHHRGGKLFTESLEAERARFIRKYHAALRPRYVQTTSAHFYLTGSRLGNRLLNTKLGRSIYSRLERWTSR